MVIIAAIAAVVAFAPGGGTGSNVVLQAVWLAFLAALVWVAVITYRERRTQLYGLGDRRRAALYAAAAVVAVTLTATSHCGAPPAVRSLAGADRRRPVRGLRRAVVRPP